jgi:twitching motility protein PilT
MAKIDDLFKIMTEQGASDLHLSAGSPPYMRHNGDMLRLNMEGLSNEDVQALVFEILNEKQRRQFIENWELDCAYTVEGLARFRCNIFMQRKGMGGVFRIIPDKIKTAEELNLPPEIMALLNAHKGLICVTGPTGSGKSTTLAALINHINQTRQAHIITIEDPIEFVHPNLQSLINQREVSSHTKSFANALKATLREDPDIILVGEMRDIETIALALTAAETGHLVFGTLHTSSAAKTVDRIIDVFPEGRQSQVRVQLAESLRGVVAQTLLPRADKPGRVAAFEILNNNKAIANLIREGKTFQIPSTMQITRSAGNVTFEASLEGLLQRGSISKEQMNDALGKGEEIKAGGGSGGASANPSAGSPSSASQTQAPIASQSAQVQQPPQGLSGFANRFKKQG